MLGVDLCDQQSIVKKDKKQKRFYLRIFIALLMKAINNAYIIEGQMKPHMVQGKGKRDLLAFKEELALALVRHTRVANCGKGRKRRSTAEVKERRLANVGIHLPQKGEGKEHRCVVCRKKRAFRITANSDRDVKECPYTLSKKHFAALGVSL